MEEEKSFAADYIGLLRYLDESQEKAYSDPDVGGIDEQEKQRLSDVRTRGEWAVSQLSVIASECRDHFNLNISQPITWLDGSKTKTRKTLCAQMKYDDYRSNPSNISIYVEKNGEASGYYRVSLDISDGCSRKQMNDYHSYLDLQIDSSSGLVLAAKPNVWGNPEAISDSPAEAKDKVEKRLYRKVQLCWFVQRKNEETNEHIHDEIMMAVEALLPYYQHVLGFNSKIYWPSKEEYDPGLSVDDWIELLNDPEVTHDENLRMFAMMIDQGGEATCTRLAKVYGGKYTSYNNYGRIFGERVQRKTGCPPCPDGDAIRYFPIPFVGRHVIEEGKQRYSWKLRDELFEALQSVELPDIRRKGMTQMKQFGLNTILYGPPGTGKTYNTVRYAVSICEPDLDVDNMEYSEVLERFNELKKAKRIEFTTFHQSYGYEEFIEGIKPVLATDASGDGTDVKYDIFPGVFKQFCDRARKKKIDTGIFVVPEDAVVWKVTIRNNVLEDCYHNDRVRIDFDMDDEGAKGFVQDIAKGDIILTTDGSRKRIQGIAIATENDAYLLNEASDRITRGVRWIAKDIDEDITKYNNGKMLQRMTVARVPYIRIDDLLAKVAVNTDQQAIVEENTDPYVFIIDEINRGNISKIFGELITLIESTKRYGADEAMETTLPYSGESFSVPNNVYILGTMNTADRSIAIMDTALRRRFEFKEMMPDVKVLEGITVSSEGETLNVSEMLSKINERIEFLYDREHTIGHAFFTSLRDDPSLKNLAMIFKNKVVPLLQEYFYEDYEKIQLVLGDNEKSDSNYKFILDDPADERKLFKGVPNLDIREKKYSIQERAFDLIRSYIEIM